MINKELLNFLILVLNFINGTLDYDQYYFAFK